MEHTMILLPDGGPPSPSHFEASFPFGLIGLGDLQRFVISPIEESWPFVSMNALVGSEVSFVAVEPKGLVGGYEIEVSEEDVDALQLTSAEDALILNIVTVHSSQPLHVTINLAGPLVINRNTLVGKQLILLNARKFSPRHLLIDQRVNAA